MDAKDLKDLLSSSSITIASETLGFVTQAGVADVGSAIDTVVFAAFANNKICDLLGVMIGEKSGSGVASSIVFTTGVMDSTLEQAWDYSKNTFNAQRTNMIAVVGAATTGAWACHYPSGLLIIKKKTNGTTQVITSYKIRNNAININTGDIEIGAVEIKNATSDDRVEVETVGADGVNNTKNALVVKARLKSFNGTTWDRIRSGITAVTATLTGWLNTLPYGVFNATPTVRTEGQGGPMQQDANGNTLVALGSDIRGERSAFDILAAQPKWNMTRITTATTTLIKSGAGLFGGIVYGLDVATNVTTVYDALTATGTPKYVQTTGAAILSDPGKHTGQLGEFATGLTIVTSQAVDITVLWL